MPRPLARRVCRLEKSRGRPCTACGGGVGVPVYEVVMPEAAATLPASQAARKPAVCRNCRRPTEIWVTMAAARGGDG